MIQYQYKEVSKYMGGPELSIAEINEICAHEGWRLMDINPRHEGDQCIWTFERVIR